MGGWHASHSPARRCQTAVGVLRLGSTGIQRLGPAESEKMRIQIEKGVTLCTVFASGGIDAMTCPRLATSLNALIDEGETRIILDLGQTVHISSAGLRVILTTAKRLHGCGQFAISSANVSVFHILRLAGIADVVDVYPEVESARAAISASWSGP